MDYCDVFISCLDSHSDGTHSLQRIHWWASHVMLHFSKSLPIKKQTFKFCMACVSKFSFWVTISFNGCFWRSAWVCVHVCTHAGMHLCVCVLSEGLIQHIYCQLLFSPVLSTSSVRHMVGVPRGPDLANKSFVNAACLSVCLCNLMRGNQCVVDTTDILNSVLLVMSH